jgi:hypothetical protein
MGASRLFIVPSLTVCAEKQRLLHSVSEAITEVLSIQNQQLTAIIPQGSDFGRFDPGIRGVLAKKEQRKNAYLRHVEEHGC